MSYFDEIIKFESQSSHSTGPTAADGRVTGPKRFQHLAGHELVEADDRAANVHQGLKLWEGPAGFRADAFIHPMYRGQNRAALAGSAGR